MGEWQQVREGVWFCQMQPAAVNAGLVVGETGVLLVDTGSSPAQGRELAASAERLVGRPVTHVVVTHWHFDHFFGLAGVHEQVPGVVSIGHESMMAHLDDADPDIDPEVIRDQLDFEKDELVAPTQQISMIKAVDLGGRHAEIVHLGRGHTDGDLFVLVPDARVIFTGDLVETSGPPAIGPDSTLKEWPKAIDGAVKHLRDDAEVLFVPGHGAPVDLDVVLQQRADLSALYGIAEDLVRKGVSLDEALDDLNGAQKYDWPFERQDVADRLPFVYDELARQGVTKSKELPLLNQPHQH